MKESPAGVPVCAFGSKRYVGHIVGLLYSLTHIKAFNLKAIPTDVAKDRLLSLKQIFQEVNTLQYYQLTEFKPAWPHDLFFFKNL